MTAHVAGDGPLAIAYRAAKDFGFAVVVACWLLWQDYTSQREDARERRELLGRLTKAIDAQTVALGHLALETHDTADVVRAHWPRVRLPARVAARAPQEASP